VFEKLNVDMKSAKFESYKVFCKDNSLLEITSKTKEKSPILAFEVEMLNLKFEEL